MRREKLKTALSVLLTIGLGGVGTVFTALFFREFRGEAGFLGSRADVFFLLSLCLGSALTASAAVCRLLAKEIVYKCFFVLLFLLALAGGVLYGVKSSGFLDRITSVEALQTYVREKGKWAPYVYIAIQFLQVAVLPIPGSITVLAGVLLFGELRASLFSLIGICLGSVAAFAIGKTLGYRVCAWFVGEETLNVWLGKIRGKDRMLLTFMFLMPFFPDDVLCFVAGLSTMGWGYFLIMTLVARSISIFSTAYFGGGNVIPYDKWWGILLWVLLFAAVVGLMVLIYRKGDKIEAKIRSLFSGKKDGKADGGRKIGVPVKDEGKNGNDSKKTTADGQAKR